MATYLGFGSFLGVGEESAWGTAVSRDHFYRLMSSSIRRVVAKTQRETLYEGSGLVSAKHFIDRDIVEGDVVILATYEGMGLLLKHTLWASGTSGPSGGYYTHTYTLGASAPTGGLTMEVCQGTGSAIVYEGCRIKSARFRVTAEGRMEITLSIVGETSGAPTSASSPTFTTTETELEGWMVGALGWNSDSYVARDAEVMIDNKLDARVKLGSKLTKDPKPTGLREITCSATIDYESDDPQNDYTGDTSATLSFSATSGTFSFGFALHGAHLTKDEIGVNTHGVLPEALTWRASHVDSSNKGIAVTVINTQSSATAA